MKNKILIVLGSLIFLILLRIAFSPRGQTPSVQSPASVHVARSFFEQALDLERQGELLEAKALYQAIIDEHPDFDRIEQVQERLEDVNIAIIFSTIQTPQTVIHVVEKGDSLSKIGQKYNTTVALIKRSNNLQSDVIRLNQRLRIWKEPFEVLVSKSQNRMILRSGNEVIKVYTVSTGKNNSTPTGVFQVETKLVDPVWFKSGAIIPPGSPDNELGARWLGFDLPGYGIHGTISPETLGRQETAGCVRMSNEDVKELYDLLTIGTQVTIID